MFHLSSGRCAPVLSGTAQRLLPSSVTTSAQLAPRPVASLDERLVSGHSASTSGRCIAQPSRCVQRSLTLRCSKQLATFQRVQRTLHKGTNRISEAQLALIVSEPSGNGSAHAHSTSHCLISVDHSCETPSLEGLLAHSRGLIDRIESSHDISTLSAVVSQAQRVMEPLHFRAALTQLQMLVETPGHGPIEKLHLQRVLEPVTQGLLQCTEQLSPQQVVSVTRALATTRCYHQPLLLRLMNAAATQAQSFTDAQASQLLCTLGRHHHHCKVVVAPELVSALLERPLVHDCTPPRTDALVQALYGCALLGQPPPTPWLEALLSYTSSHMHLVSQPQLAKVMWSLAVLGYDPGRPWVDSALERVSGRLSFSNGTQVSSMLWALAVMQHAPSAAWMGHFLWQVQRLMNRCSPRNLELLAWSLASLQYRPEAAWTNRFLRHLIRHTQRTTAIRAAPNITDTEPRAAWRPQTVAVSLWALAKLQVQPESKLLKQISRAMQALLPTCSAMDLAHITWALQRLSFLPDDKWMADAQIAMHARLSQFDLASVLMVLVALKGYSRVSPNAARMGNRNQVDSQLVSLLCMRLEALSCQRGLVLSLRSSLTLVLTLGKLQTPISRELHGYMLQQIGSYLEDIPQRKLSIVCWSICKLACGNGDRMQLLASSQLRLLPRLVHLVQGHLASPACGVEDLLQLVSGLACVSFQPGEEWLKLHEAAAVRLARQGRVRPSVASMLLQSYRRLRHAPHALTAVLRSSSMAILKATIAPPPTGDGAADCVVEAAAGSFPVASSSCSTEHLLQFIVGFAAVSFHPGEEWLHLHESCAVELARQDRIKSWSASALLQAYSCLLHEPLLLKAELMAVKLAHKRFTTRDEACAYFTDLLKTAPINTRFGEDDHQLLLALLRHHPNATEKIGAGVRSFIPLNINPMGARAFYICRTDGTCERFSYVKCCTEAFCSASSLCMPSAQGRETKAWLPCGPTVGQRQARPHSNI